MLQDDEEDEEEKQTFQEFLDMERYKVYNVVIFDNDLQMLTEPRNEAHCI
jgi:hypothetical protein